MFKDLYLCNNGVISPMDMTTMGDSSKRSDHSKIGKFDSGLKYALSILKRNNVEFEIRSGGITYQFDTTVIHDEVTTKTKEVLEIVMQKEGEQPTRKHSAFALNLGHEWEFWMAIREMYSNCLDEGGQVFFVDSEQRGESPIMSQYDTIIHLKGCEILQSIIDDWGRYFNNDRQPKYELLSAKLYDNVPDGCLRVYKSGILVYEDKKTTSRYVYDYPSADIDEMRKMKHIYNLQWSLESNICGTDNLDFIREFMSVLDGDFEHGLDLKNNLSSTWVEHVNQVYSESGEIDTYKSLLNNFKKNSKIDIGVRKLATRSTQYERTVEVRTPVKDEAVILSFEDKIKAICTEGGFTLEVPVIISNIEGVKCVGDINKKCVYVSESFSKDDIWEIIRAQYRVLYNGDVDQIYKDFADKLKS